jgi:flavin-dependent dehydrogenase
VGDAAGQVKPFSGGGIYTSLVAGRHAATTVVKAFETGDFSAQGLAAYERGWKREIGRELRKSWHLRHFGLALSDSQVERVGGCAAEAQAMAHTRTSITPEWPPRLARSAPALATLGWVTVRRPGAAVNLLRASLPFG